MRSLISGFRRHRGATSEAADGIADIPGARAPRSVTTVREEILEHGLVASRAGELADALERDGRLLEAVEALTLANRLKRDATVERRLVRLRRAAFAGIDRSLPPPSWPPPASEDETDTPAGPLEIEA